MFFAAADARAWIASPACYSEHLLLHTAASGPRPDVLLVGSKAQGQRLLQYTPRACPSAHASTRCRAPLLACTAAQPAAGARPCRTGTRSRASGRVPAPGCAALQPGAGARQWVDPWAFGQAPGSALLEAQALCLGPHQWDRHFVGSEEVSEELLASRESEAFRTSALLPSWAARYVPWRVHAACWGF